MASRFSRAWGSIIAAAITGSCLFAGVTAAASVEITHLAYSGHGAEWRIYLEEMAKRFEAESNIKVNVIQVAMAEYTPKVTSMIAGGVAPEVTDYHPAIAGALIGKGVFEDLRPYIKRDKVKMDQIPPGAVAGLTTPKGEIWGLPWDMYPMVTFFNADMFAQLGLENPAQLGEGWNHQKFAQATKRLTADTDGDGKNDRYGTYHLVWRWEMHVHQNGGQIWDKLVYPTKGMFNTQVVRQTVDWLADLIAVQKTNSESGTWTTWNGKVGMTLAYGPGVIQTYLSKASFNWGMAMQPKGTTSRAARINPDSVQIIADSKNKEAAWKWLLYLSKVENQLEMTKVTGRLPAYREAMLQYPKVMPNLPSNWMDFINTAFDPASYSPYVVPQEAANTLVNSLMGKVWNGQMASDTALQQIEEQLKPIMGQ